MNPLSVRMGLSFVVVLVTLAGCTTIYNPATERRETVLDTSVEIAVGNIARAQMGLTSLAMGRADPQQVARVQAIGRQLASVSDRQDVPYQFGVIRDKSLNAFALPGGTLYVHSALVEKATDTELACVIGHEIGHVAARHAAKHLQADLGVTVLLEIASAAGGGSGAVQIANSMVGLLRNGYSRGDELQADRLGIRYAWRAGYDPQGMITFFEKMLQETPEDAMDQALVWRRTHPLTSERIRLAKEEIARLKAETFCPACGRTYGPDVKFCEQDGTLLKKRGGP